MGEPRPEARPLLSPSDAVGEEDLDTTFPLPASLKKARSSQTIGTRHFVVATFLPWLMFTLIVILFIFAYHDLRPLVWGLFIACVWVSLLLVAMGAGRSRSVHLAVGLLCLAASCMGTCIGLYVYDKYASTYWRLQDGAEYKHVSPASKSKDYADATMLSFTSDAFVDTERTLGYMEAGTVYCVAPVATQKFSSAPEYWAAGKDCCDQRSSFRCGDVDNHRAKSGMRTLEGSDREKYTTAIRMAESVYSLTPSVTGGYSLTWLAGGSDIKDDYWESCISLLLTASTLYFFCSLGAAVILRKSNMFEQ